MDKFELQQLRDLPIEAVAEQLGMEVARHKCLCPFHDDRHPSLSFRVSTNTFRCFVCGAHGGVIDLVMMYRNVEFLEACEWLGGKTARSTGVRECRSADNTLSSKPSSLMPNPSSSFDASRYERFFLRQWLSSEAQRFLYEERRIDPRVVKWCRLTSWRDKQGVEWLQIPYYTSPCPSQGGETSKPSSLILHPSSSTPSVGTSPCPSQGGETSKPSSLILHPSSSTPSVGTSPCPSQGGKTNKPSSLILHPSSQKTSSLIPHPSSSSPSQGGVSGRWKLIGVQNRRLTCKPSPLISHPSSLNQGVGEVLPRFRFPAGSKCSIYNLQVLGMLKPEEPLYITEGASDCWAMLSAGRKAIAIPSATLVDRKELERLTLLFHRLATPLHMFPDRDGPGERLFLQLKGLLPNLEHHQLPTGCKDFGEYWKHNCKLPV